MLSVVIDRRRTHAQRYAISADRMLKCAWFCIVSQKLDLLAFMTIFGSQINANSSPQVFYSLSLFIFRWGETPLPGDCKILIGLTKCLMLNTQKDSDPDPNSVPKKFGSVHRSFGPATWQKISQDYSNALNRSADQCSLLSYYIIILHTAPLTNYVKLGKTNSLQIYCCCNIVLNFC